MLDFRCIECFAHSCHEEVKLLGALSNALIHFPRYKLDEFEFSQSYLFWCDKFEKSNFFLENILATLNEATDSRLIQHLLTSPVQDGGQWDMLVNLIEKV